MKEDTTPCGKTFGHEWHSFKTRSGTAICDGVIRSRKTKPWPKKN